MESIWLDAINFEDYGGFIPETQFVREMGQPYLLANGVGAPGAPAVTRFCTTEEGYYRVHIRTKNWCPSYAPDGLVVEIDGTRAQKAAGEMHVSGWYFEVGGDFMLAAGEHTVKVYDTQGWFARFACLLITNDYDLTPSRELPVMKRQRAAILGLSDTCREEGGYDLIVVGGGVGGIVTAIAAARYGLKTALLHDRPLLGGNASDEACVALEGGAHRGYHETGIVYELKAYRHHENKSWSETFEVFTAREENLHVFCDLLVTGAETANGRITGLLAQGTRDLCEHHFTAPLYVDASGDGWLGYYAGALYRVGREAAFQHGESFAPPVADGNTMSGCATVPSKTETLCGFQAEETDAPVPFTAPAWASRLPEGDALGRTPSRLYCGEWWLEMPNDYDDLFEGEYVRDAMLRMSLGYFDWLKNSWCEKEKAANLRLKALGTYNAKRETRRLVGDYLMTENDFTEGRTFPDAVGYCGWNIDVHHVGGIFSGKDGKFTTNKKIPITPVPFGALCSKNISNLMMVGRCMSVTHLGLGPVRVQLTLGTLGQAVGTAAYLCRKWGELPRGIRHSHMDELQQLLLKDGMTIPGVTNHDPADLALQATPSATSAAPNGAPQNVINGKPWPHSGVDYAWVSADPLPQSLTLQWQTPKTVRQARITLDLPFDEYQYGYMAQPVARRMATALTLSALTEDGWQELCRVRDNFMRLLVLDFAPTKASAIRLTVEEMMDSPAAVITEVRLY